MFFQVYNWLTFYQQWQALTHAHNNKNLFYRFNVFVRESGRRLHETIVRLLAVVSPQLGNHCQQGIPTSTRHVDSLEIYVSFFMILPFCKQNDV
jgi:hypothetical protein